MGDRQTEITRQDLDELTRKVNELTGQVSALQNQPPQLASPLTSLQPIPVTPPPSAANQIRNGEEGHSNNTWFSAIAAPTADEGKESAWWFSHDAPVTGQVLDFTISPANVNNHTLKAYIDDGGVHSTYNPAYCDWDRQMGEARLQGDKSLDAPFPTNRLVSPNRAVEYLGALIALRDSRMVLPEDYRIWAGCWDEAQADWISAAFPFSLSAAVRGVPAGTTERRYSIFARTDRGYSFLSAETVVLNAPDDASFGPNVDVYLAWEAIVGIIEYWVYRHDVTAGKFRLLTKIGSGANTYGDNNSILAGDEGGYPTFVHDRAIAYVATGPIDLKNLPVDGAPWRALFLNIPVPSDYDQKITTGHQVLRLGQTKALDRQMGDAATTAASSTVDSATAEFTSLDTGRLATLFDTSGNILHGPEAITFVSVTQVTFATVVATTNVNATLFIEGGGDHGLLIDAIHVSYVPGAAFGPYPDDVNRKQNGGQDPIAAPNHSSQGGAGGGGGSDPGDGGLVGVPTKPPTEFLTA